jgi:uroporphyrinogen decarboxylase
VGISSRAIGTRKSNSGGTNIFMEVHFMDKRTRVLNALNKRPVDHVPVGFWVHFFDKGVFGDTCIQAHIDYYNSLDLDFVKVMSDGYFGFPIDGEVSTVEDLKKVRPIDASHPWIREQLDRAKAVVAALGKDRCVFFNLFNPFSSLKYGFTEDLLESDNIIMRLLKEDKNAVLRALDVAAAGNALLAELLITEAGCDGIYYCVQNAETDRFTEAEYREIVGPGELYVLEHINRFSENTLLHCCGFMGKANRVSLWFDYPVKCANWATAVENIPLHEGRYLYRGKAVLGGFDTHWGMQSADEQRGILYHGTKEDLQAYTKNLIADTGKLGLLIGGDCTMDFRIDYDRIRWIIEAARSV